MLNINDQQHEQYYLRNQKTVDQLSASLQYFGWLDYCIFTFMLICCITIGIYYGFIEKKNNNKIINNRKYESVAADYLIGSRQMKVFPISMSLIASFVSGIMLLGNSTEIYLYGIQYIYISFGIITLGIVMNYIFLPVFYELELTSTYEYLEARFDRRVRLFGSVLFTIGTITWLPIVIYVPALAFNQVSGISVYTITPIVCLICIFYTCVGGLKAVVWTDVVQIIILSGTIILIIIKGTIDVGGLSVVLNRGWESGRIETPDFSIDPTTRHTFWSLFIGGLFYWTQTNAISQSMMQRYLSLPSLSATRKALIIYIIGLLCIYFACWYNGLIIYALYHDCDPLTTKLAKAKDQLLPLQVMQTMGKFPGVPGLFVAGVFSAALSTLSTGLNAMAAVVLEDFYKPYAKRPLSERETGLLMRGVVFLIGALCLGLVYVVEQLGTVLQLTMSLGSITLGPLLGIFLLGLMFPWINGKSALSGGVFGLGIMSWIVTSAQSSIASGQLSFPMKPVSTAGCTYTFDNSTLLGQSILANTTSLHMDNDETSTLFRISYLWYGPIGAIVTILTAMLTVITFGSLDPRDVDQSLLTPFIRRFIKPRPTLSFQPDIKEQEHIITAYELKS